MTGTSGSLSIGGGGLILPAPKVQLYMPAAPSQFWVADASPVNDATVEVTPLKHVKVTFPGIPSAILDDIATYRPQVELIRHTQLNSRENSASGNGAKTGGYVHPSHGPVASGNGSFTHGGSHGGVGPSVQAVRPTEWLINSGADAIDVTQGILGFMCYGPFVYRDNAGNISALKAVYPASRTNRRNRISGRRFPYSPVFRPGYFEFRLSIIDTNDARGKRITGPHSTRISCTNNQFPFLPAGVDASGAAQADPLPSFDGQAVNFWLGSTSRLPV